MDGCTLPIIPKVKTIYISTGNTVNWQSIKRIVAQSATEELTQCIGSTLETWLQTADGDQLQFSTSCDFGDIFLKSCARRRFYHHELVLLIIKSFAITFKKSNIPFAREVNCFNERCQDIIDKDERCDFKITLKIFVNCLQKDSVVEAIEKVMCELCVSAIETVIISVPEKNHNLQDLQPLWQALEEQVELGRVYSLGISDLNRDQLVELYTWAKEKPTINQVNLTTCCVIPPELSEFAKRHDIQLLTHSDPPVILSAESFEAVMTSKLSEQDGKCWQPQWVARYSVLIKTRGIIKSKGYSMRAER